MDEVFLQSIFELNEIITRESFIQRFQFIQENNLSNSQIMSLFYLRHNKKVSVNALARHLGISNPAVSQLVDKLVRTGLVQKIDNPQDRRGKLLTLTEEGKRLVSQAKIAHHQWIQELAETIEPEDIPVIKEAIGIILEKHFLLQSTKLNLP